MEMPTSKLPAPDIYENILAFLSLIIIWTAVIYYFSALNLLGLSLAISATLLSFWYWRRPQITSLLVWRRPLMLTWPKITDPKDRWLLASYLLLASGQVALALTSRSGQALISPWEKIPPLFFGLYGASILVLALILARRTLALAYKSGLLSAHYLISFGLAAAVYQIGYGFDPFVHEAAMKYIADHGAILPKTPYYLGQYGLIITINKLSGLPISWLNIWLVPVLSALLLPHALTRYLQEPAANVPEKERLWLAALFLPCLTFSPLIVTTPQNLSYLFLALAVLVGQRQEKLALASYLSLGAAAIHPLTGLPALAWCGFLWLKRYSSHLSKIWMRSFTALIFLLAMGGLPLAFLLAGGARLAASSSQYWEKISTALPLPMLAGQEGFILNITYFISGNLPWLLVLGSASAIIWSWKTGYRPMANLTIIAALGMAYLISWNLEFSALIDYEQADYAKRIPVIMLIFALPFYLRALTDLLASIQARPRLERLAWLVGGTGLAVISLYASYPRFDHYWNSRGYSTGEADIATVQTIKQDAAEPYVVLANQQVSAAALRELGFDLYRSSLEGPVYAYAIPTGGPLYQFYLDMVYKKPARGTMQAAADFSQVKTAYLAVNKYWNKSGQIINAAKISADKWWSVSDAVYVFRYDF